ncbi:MAG: hypothetical protein H0U80_04870, partial [Solirubrobacterales bacterium]|nr:hypothetical protein [Solirubrobacterales bacterium]
MTTPARIASLVALMLVTLSVAGPARAEAAFTLGLSEQKLGMWQDARFAALGVRHVRLIVAYDLVLKNDFSRYDAWMAAADARGMDVLIAFNHATNSNTRLPSVSQYRKAVRNVRARYPRVKAMSAWNEANHTSQPTHRNPRRAASYYNALREECRGCRIVAADVLDQTGMEKWLSTFKRYARAPKLWGLHNYGDANHFKPLKRTGTAKLLKLVKGEVWLTEAGGIVRFGRYYRGGRAGEARAARATQQTFALARMSSRIKRVYLYHWDAEK